MQNRSAARLFVLSVTFVALLLMSGCSSGPNPALNLGGIDIEEVFHGQVTRVNQILNGITNQASLDKAYDELQVVSTNFDDLIFNSAKLSPDGQTALSMLAMTEAPKMESLVNQVKESPALDDKLGGFMEGIYGKILGLI